MTAVPRETVDRCVASFTFGELSLAATVCQYTRTLAKTVAVVRERRAPVDGCVAARCNSLLVGTGLVAVAVGRWWR